MEYLVMNYFDDDPYNIVKDDVSSDSNTTSNFSVRDTPIKSDLSESISSSTNTANDSTTSQTTTILDPELKNTLDDEISSVLNNTGTVPAKSEQQNGIAPNDNIIKPKLSFQCNICAFSSKTRFSLARHHQVAHKTESANIHFVAVQSRETNSSTNSNIQNHTLKSLDNHLEKKICFRCELCDFSTNIRFALARHQSTHKEGKTNNKISTSGLDDDDSVSESDESYYSFSDINDEFGNIFEDSDLDKDSSASKPELFKATKEIITPQFFYCQKCSYRTKQIGFLKQHEKTHPLKKSNFACSHCPFEGKSEKSLLFHLVNAHRELSSLCQYCDRIMPNQLNIEHTKKCKVKALYKCVKCKKFKTTRIVLLKHLKLCKKMLDESKKEEPSKTLLKESQSCGGDGQRGPSDKVKIGRKPTDSIETLEKPRQNTKAISDKQYVCNICSLFETTDKTSFNKHLLMHLQSNQQIEIELAETNENEKAKIDKEQSVEGPPDDFLQENESPKENCESNNEPVVPKQNEDIIIDNEPTSSNKETPTLDETQQIVKEESVSGHLCHDELIIKEEPKLNVIETGSYNCDQCSHKSNNERALRKHLRIVHMGKELSCPHCSYVMKGDTHSMSSHVSAHRINKPIFKCSFCDFKSFKRIVNKHSVQMHGKNIKWQDTMINCPYCSFVCKNQLSYKDHARRHILLKDQIQKCEQCDYKSFKINVIKHQNKCHVPPDEIFRCTLCSYNTKKKASLQSHILRHTKLKKKLYSCTKCNFKSLIANAVRGHMKQMHGYVYRRKLKCNICSYSAHTVNKLTRHKSYHATGSLIYKCNFCDYTSFMNTVKVHSIKKHNVEFNPEKKRSYLKQSNRKKINIKFKSEEEQIYHCASCSYASNFKYNLQLHIQKHRENIPIINCTDCDFKSFQAIVAQHSKLIHNKRMDYAKKLDNYSCELCSFTAKWHSQIKNHSLLHTVYKNSVYDCNDCNFKGFRVSIIKHYRVVHGKTITDANLELKRKLFECPYCSYTGKNLDAMKCHELLHTEAKEPIYDCKHCDFRTTLAGIRRHSSKEHGEKFKAGPKREPGVVESNEEISFNTKNKWHNCKFCSYTTPNYTIYKAHVEKHNDEGLTVVKCNYCDFKGFKTTVGKHIKAKHEVIFSCEKCSYSTEDKRKYSNHISLHTSETLMYKCSMCEFASISLVIRRHMINEHPQRTKEQNVLQLVKDYCKNKDSEAVEKENVINHSNGN